MPRALLEARLAGHFPGEGREGLPGERWPGGEGRGGACLPACLAWLPARSFPSWAGGRQERQRRVGVGLGLDSLPNRQRPPMFSSRWELLVPKPRFIFVHTLFRESARAAGGGAFAERRSGLLGRRRRFCPGLPSWARPLPPPSAAPHPGPAAGFPPSAPEAALFVAWGLAGGAGRSRSKRC